MTRSLLAALVALTWCWYGGAALADGDRRSAPEPDAEICGCVGGKIDTDAKAARCSALLDAMTPAQVVELTGQCNAQRAAADGPDLCFCLKGFHTDPKIIKACEALIGKDTKPSEIARLGAQC